MKTVTAQELKKIIALEQNFLLLDVREDFEHEHFNIGGSLMPIVTVLQNLQQIPTDIPVVFYCQKGICNVIVIQKLEEGYGYTNLINLAGGMKASKSETVQ